ncbi:replication protein RepA [Falsochrobactrum shanghaiense]|uniref:replication protein RepA n=1 Tax=Falsochrobactrum shanghaiense TaxID=2201899 RepID=UPI0018EE69B6
MENISIADSANLWWKPKSPEQGALWESTVTLSEKFFREVTENPIPIDLRALRTGQHFYLRYVTGHNGHITPNT